MLRQSDATLIENATPMLGLRSLSVRPIYTQERERWDLLMAQHHYLGHATIVGNALRYVAIRADGQWVALLGWGAAAFKCRPRDEWIGWSQAVQWQRLKLIANNVRFLVLPEAHIPNLASRVLSLNLKRLSGDWQAIYGHPLMLVETFVDPIRFTGACYRAAGWTALGLTRGFRRNGGKYFYHAHPKTILIRPLQRYAAERLRNPLTILYQEELPVQVNSLNIDNPGGLLDCLRALPDPRKARGIRHRMISILATAIAAALSGAKGVTAMAEWAGRASQPMLRRLGCRRKNDKYLPPSEPTIRRLLRDIDAQKVDDAVGRWLMAQNKNAERRALAVDGKTLRGAKRKDGTQIKLLSAILHKEAVVIAQQNVPAETNEIPILPMLLADTDIKGMVVTADAIHTQKDTATFLVREKRADYLFTVKDNQSTLKQDIEALHLEAIPPSAQNHR